MQNRGMQPGSNLLLEEVCGGSERGRGWGPKPASERRSSAGAGGSPMMTAAVAFFSEQLQLLLVVLLSVFPRCYLFRAPAPPPAPGPVGVG